MRCTHCGNDTCDPCWKARADRAGPLLGPDAPDDTHIAMRHVAAHERQFVNQDWIDDLKALLAEVRMDERKRTAEGTGDDR